MEQKDQEKINKIHILLQESIKNVEEATENIKNTIKITEENTKMLQKIRSNLLF